jgi:SAM-dependent methyltransferase
MMRGHWDARPYPRLVYVETTNACNARCTFCLYGRMERPVHTMSQDTFERIARKVQRRGLKIGAVFCFGEPLADPGLFDKIRFARSIKVARPYLGLNTNAALLTPEKYADIVATCSNITLSFVNVGEDFERLTGLNWEQCYRNALDFIAYRDAHAPRFQVEIGCNDVPGVNRGTVQKAFRKVRVDWARDAAIDWNGKTITGVIDRSIMYHKWKCDGYNGYMQIKPNGDCCFCAYDVVRNETRFANILEHDWPEIEANFKKLWRQPSSLCLRCDFWWNYLQAKACGWSRECVDNDWQSAYMDEMTGYWDSAHKAGEVRFLTGTPMRETLRALHVAEHARCADRVLEVGIGTGISAHEHAEHGRKVDGLDISQAALDKARDVLDAGYIDPSDLLIGRYDLATCLLVLQHMADVDVYPLLRNVLRSLRDDGLLAVQYASPPNPSVPYSETLHDQQMGTVRRTREHFRRIAEICGGRIIWEANPWTPAGRTVTDNAVWNVAHIEAV